MRGKHNRRGQVLVMVTLALVAMCGIMGLAVDLGWAYYVEKTSQAAADAAAIAAVAKAFDLAGGQAATGESYGAYVGAGDCPLAGPVSLAEGCEYARRNGFNPTSGGRQRVHLSAGTGTPPTATRVGPVQFWATAVVAERIPQLFSAVMGHTMGGASSRATAAVVWSVAPGSIYALDRQFDAGTPSGGVGNDFYVQGGGHVLAGGDVYMASTAGGGSGPPGSGREYYASEGGGGYEVWTQGGSSRTYIRGAGWTTDPENFYYGPDRVQEQPINGVADDDQFKDPMRGKGQPPPPQNLPDCPILRERKGSEWLGVIRPTDSPTGVWGPGNYYTVDSNGNATGDRLVFAPGLKFGSTGTCNTNASQDQSGFGDFVFFGGVKLDNGYVTFDPGRYVFAGVKQQGSNPGILLDGRTQAYLTDRTDLVGGQAVPNTDAGEIFIFTDTRYKGGPTGDIELQIPEAVKPIAGQLRYGIVDLHAGGAGDKTEINLHGLNAGSDSSGSPPTSLPSELSTFTPVVFWQDQSNSTVKYTRDGYIDCGQAPGRQFPCATDESLDHPIYTDITNGSPEMSLQATPSNHLFGVVYQPRGAWVVIHGGQSQMVAPLQIISGAYEIRGGPYVILQPLASPLRRQVVALVE